MDLFEIVFTSVLSAGGTGIITIVAMRTDMIWIKKIIDDLHKRVHNLETRRREYR